MTRRTIARLRALFAILFAIVIARQAYVQVIAGPQIARSPYNPRRQLLSADRGSIVASDGTILAQSVAGERRYPLGAELAQTVGYISDRYGTSGLESAYDGALSAPDLTGNPIESIARIAQAFIGRAAAQHGAEIVTTIDPAIEETLFDELNRYARGAGVVIDPRTGAVLAMASVPSFDPNRLDTIFPELRSDAASPLLNRAIDGLYPPGSTFKIVTAGAALESGTVTMQTEFDDPGYLDVGNFVLHDDESEATGRQNLTGAFALSSNVDFAQIALKMGAPVFYSYLARFGIGSSLDFQLPAARDRVPPQQGLLPGELAQMGFGQGALLMTPLQMALIAATVADDGVEPRPFIVRQVRYPSGRSSTYGASELSEPLSADTAAKIAKMMVAVVQYGTGTSARIPGMTVAGKTGTATNPFGAPHSWFVCFAPADHPRVAAAIVVENAGYGAAVAAPIARAVLASALERSP